MFLSQCTCSGKAEQPQAIIATNLEIQSRCDNGEILGAVFSLTKLSTQKRLFDDRSLQVEEDIGRDILNLSFCVAAPVHKPEREKCLKPLGCIRRRLIVRSRIN